MTTSFAEESAKISALQTSQDAMLEEITRTLETLEGLYTATPPCETVPEQATGDGEHHQVNQEDDR